MHNIVLKIISRVRSRQFSRGNPVSVTTLPSPPSGPLPFPTRDADHVKSRSTFGGGWLVQKWGVSGQGPRGGRKGGPGPQFWRGAEGGVRGPSLGGGRCGGFSTPELSVSYGRCSKTGAKTGAPGGGSRGGSGGVLPGGAPGGCSRGGLPGDAPGGCSRGALPGGCPRKVPTLKN